MPPAAEPLSPGRPSARRRRTSPARPSEPLLPEEDEAVGVVIPRALLVLDRASASCLAALQLLVVVTQRAAAPAAQAHLLCRTCAALGVAAFVWFWPAVHWRHRTLILPAVRIGLHLLPIARLRGAGVAMLLERAAQPGWRGAVADALRVLCGSRLLGIALGGIVLLMRPSLTLLTQAALLLLRSHGAYCEAPLLADPLTVRRIAALATGLEYAATPILFLPPAIAPIPTTGTALLQGKAPSVQVCHAAMSFAGAATTVLIPTLLSVYWWRGEEEEPAPPRGTATQSRRRRPAGWLARVASRALDAGDGVLRGMLRSPAGPVSRAVAAYWLLAVCWFVCKRLAGLH